MFIVDSDFFSNLPKRTFSKKSSCIYSILSNLISENLLKTSQSMDALRRMDTGSIDDQNRPPIFADQYPSPVRPPLNWHDIPGTSQSHISYGIPPTVGFNMQPQGFPVQPNFQFGAKKEQCGRTVQFPFSMGSRANNERRIVSSVRCKRKTDSPPLQASKQFITEEKMSEHLSKLQISSETPSEMESEETKEKRLYMCEEMKRFRAQSDPIIPESLLTKMNRSCTALVLWRPPESIFASSLFDYDDYVEDDTGNNNNNNEDNFNRVEQPINNLDLVNDVEFEEL